MVDAEPAGEAGIRRHIPVALFPFHHRHAVGPGGDQVDQAGAPAVQVVAALALVGGGGAAPEESFRKTIRHFQPSFGSNLRDSTQVTTAVTTALMTSAMMML